MRLPRRTLVQRILLPLGLLMAMVLCVLGGLDYTFTVDQSERAARGLLLRSVQTTATAQASTLLAAQHQVERLAQEYMRRWHAAKPEALDATANYWFAVQTDGSLRVRTDLGAFPRRPGVLLPPTMRDNGNLRRQAALAFQLMREWGPPMFASDQYHNSYYQPARGGLVVYGEGETPDLEEQANAPARLRLASPQANPARQAFWGEPRFDRGTGQWMVAVGVPIDLNGQWAGVMSLDVVYDRLLSDTLRHATPGTWNALVDQQGKPVFHTLWSGEQWQSDRAAPPLTPAVLARVQAQGQSSQPLPVVLDSPGDDALLGIARIEGPDWLLVRVYPKSLLANQVWLIARATLTLWLLALATCFALLMWILRRQVTLPLSALTLAIRNISAGRDDLALSIHREDELGRLGRAFNAMLRRLRERDRALQDRAAQLEREIAERRAHETLIERMRYQLATAAEAAFMGVWDVDLVNKEVEWDLQMYRLYGRDPATFRPDMENWPAAVHPDDRDMVLQRIRQAILGEQEYRDVVFRITWPDGTIRYLTAHGQVVRDQQGQALRMIGANVDITEKKLAERRIVHMATHDALTGLANRSLLYDRLDQALRQAQRQNKLVAVMFLDLDRFKTINDSLGHTAGDALLVQVAERIESILRRSDTLARPGGDEFVAVLPLLDSAEDADVVAGKLLEALSQPFKVLEHELTSTPSIGISLYPGDGKDPDTLIRNADAAMYSAKSRGRNTWERYTPELSVQAGELLDIEISLRHALERDEFRLHFQPKYCLKRQAVVGAEALLRWQRPGHGLLLPGRFIPVAEERGLIVAIGRWVLQEACRQLDAWREQGYQTVPLALNLAAPHFSDPGLVAEVRELLTRYGLAPSQLAIEVTESALLQDEQRVRANLRSLKDMGVSLSLDDFGTGYSSLSYLHRFPLDQIKIDRSFVQSIGQEPDAPLVDAILSIGRALHLTVVAEGVETEAQHDYLVERQCDQVQGFLYCRPVSADSFAELLQRAQPLF